jgi:hypothetical protein
MLLIAAVLMVACSDDDEMSINNASNVTVGFSTATFKSKENAGLFKVPLVVTGKLNGCVKMQIKVEADATSPAVEEKNYLMTTKTYIIGSDAVNDEGIMIEKPGIEVMAIDDGEGEDFINEARKFTITITSVEGATIGATATSEVILRDADSDPYDRLQGNWTVTATDDVFNGRDGEDHTFPVTITAPALGDSEYGNYLYLNNFPKDGLSIKMFYSYDEDSETGSLLLEAGQIVGTGLNFGGDNSNCDAKLYLMLAGGGPTDNASINITWNNDFSTLELGEPAMLLKVFNHDSGAEVGWWDGYSTVRVAR